MRNIDSNHPAVKLCNKLVSAEIRKARSEFESKLAANIKNNRKSFFAYVRVGGRARVTQGSLVGSDGRNLFDGSEMKYMVEMVEEYNRYILSVFISENLQYLPQAEMVFTGVDHDKCIDVASGRDGVYWCGS